jgi:hypothetical protein
MKALVHLVAVKRRQSSKKKGYENLDQFLEMALLCGMVLSTAVLGNVQGFASASG